MAQTAVDEDALSELRRQVVRKYGRIRKVLLQEVSIAVRERAEKLGRELDGATGALV